MRKPIEIGLMLAVLAGAFAAVPEAQAPDVRLADAARRQDWITVRTLLKGGADVNSAQPDGATALAWAAHWNAEEIVRQLIAAGADVNRANDLGVTPLALACVNGSAAVVEALLNAGAAPDVTRDTGETALMTAARTGNTAVVKLLLGFGANPNANATRTKQTALMVAISEGHADVVRTLVEAGADVNARTAGGFTPLLFAARHGDRAAAAILLDAGARIDDPATDLSTPLVMAIASGREETALLLLERGASPDDERPGYTPLHAAVSRNALTVAQALLARGARPNAGLSRASGAVFGRTDGAGTEVRPPVPAGADTPAGGRRGRDPLAGATPFFLAARLVNVPMMKLLAEGGADTAPVLPNGTTTLMVASGLTQVQGPRARRGDVSQFYANWNEEDSLDSVRYLVDLGADVNATNASGQTALHSAAYMGAMSVVRFLVERGARLDVQDSQGQTPYRIAEGHLNIAGQGVTEWPETAALLRKLGANPTLGVDGRTMLRQYGKGLDAPRVSEPR
jgi:ankyrin repeat protein